MDAKVCSWCDLHAVLQMHLDCQSVWWRTLLSGLARLGFPFCEDVTYDNVCGHVCSLREFVFHNSWILSHASTLLVLSLRSWMLCLSSLALIAVDAFQATTSCDHISGTELENANSQDALLSTYPALIVVLPLRAASGAKEIFTGGVNCKYTFAKGQCPRLDDRDEFIRAQGAPSLRLHVDLHCHCVVCGRWFKHPTSLSPHLGACHSEMHRNWVCRSIARLIWRALRLAASIPSVFSRDPALRYLDTWEEDAWHCSLLQRCVAQSPSS